jgi:hypothetical protein
VIEAFSGEKGLSGVYAHDDMHEVDKTTRKVRTTKTAKIYLADGANDGKSAQDAHPSGYGASTRESDSKRREPARSGDSSVEQEIEEQEREKQAREDRAVKNAKKALARLANLYNLAMDVTVAVVAPHFIAAKGRDMTDEQFQATLASLFIAAQRAALDAELPVRNLNGEPLAKEQPDPVTGDYPW